MLVPGVYTTVMPYGESRPITFPSQNQHIHEPHTTLTRLKYYGHSGLIKMKKYYEQIILKKIYIA